MRKLTQIKITWRVIFIAHVGTENNPFVVRVVERRKVGKFIVRNLPFIAALGIHDHNLEIVGLNQFFFQ